MGASPCAEIGLHVTMLAATDDDRAGFIRLLESGAPQEAFVDAFTARCAPEMARVVRDELDELPAHTVSTIVSAWAAAEGAGKRFELRSVVPDQPLAFARDRRVRLAVDADSEGIVVSISHIPGRHAEWYRAQAGVA